MPSDKQKVLIASDHAGYELKEQVERILRERGFEVEDLGTTSAESTDYADYAHPLAKRVASGEVKQGVLICGTGLGMSYVANRYPGVRAAVSWAPEIATLARQHNDANVLVLPARFVSPRDAEKIVDSWLAAKFEGGRHARRVEKIERSGN
jgi:ribose 5-phosphate isomerase B